MTSEFNNIDKEIEDMERMLKSWNDDNKRFNRRVRNLESSSLLFCAPAGSGTFLNFVDRSNGSWLKNIQKEQDKKQNDPMRKIWEPAWEE